MSSAIKISAGLLLIAAQAAAAQAVPPVQATADTCVLIRAQIQAQTGQLPATDTALLEKLGSHPECRFSSAEVYRAAYGDKPIPRMEQRVRRGKHHHDDDD